MLSELRPVFVLLVFFSMVSPLCSADDDVLPPVALLLAKDLRADAGLAQDKQLPILLYFASDYCTYCRYVEEEQLKPMLRNRDYDSRVMVRRISATGFGSIVYFDGKLMSAAQIADHYHAGMTPTLVFVNAQGEEIAPRIVGVASPDYYGGDLDESINQALKSVRMVSAKTRH